MDKGLKNEIKVCDVSLPLSVLAGWQNIVDTITRVSGAYVGLIMSTCDNDIGVLVASKTEGNPYHVGDMEHLSGSGLYCERVIKTMNKLSVPNALKSDEWDHNPDLKYNLLAYEGLPIRKPDGSPFGTICLLDNKENLFTDELRILMESMRDLIESQLKIESLYRQNEAQSELLQEKVLQLNQANQMLKENEEKYKFILENTTDYIWVYNFTREKFTYASPNVQQMRGFTPDEILLQRFENTATPDSLESIRKQIQETITVLKANPESTLVFYNEIRQARKDGSIIWVEYTAKCRYNQDQEIEAVGVSRNIENRKLAEARLSQALNQLQQSEERYRLIAENTSDVIWMYNLNQRIFTFISPSVFNLRGLTVEEALIEKLEDSMTKESFTVFNKQIGDALEHLSENRCQNQLSVTEIQQLKKDGELIWVEVTTRYVINRLGEVEIIGVSRNADKRKKREQKIYHISTHDHLTDTYNRSYFEEKSEEALRQMEYSREPLSLLIIDVDYFKRVNDTFGHLVGDEILKIVSKTTAAAIRSSDILARFGGEEFIILLPGADLAGATIAAEKIRTRIENTHYPHNLKITVSIGITEHDEDENLDDMCRHADTALYEAKKNGRNQVAVYRGLDSWNG